jgi:hypothetical protein
MPDGSKMTNKVRTFICTILLLIFYARPSFGIDVYDFSFTGNPPNGGYKITNGLIYVDPTQSNLITDFTGTLDWNGATSVLTHFSVYNAGNVFFNGASTNPFFTSTTNDIEWDTSTGGFVQLSFLSNSNYILQLDSTPIVGTVSVLPEINSDALSKALLLLFCMYLIGGSRNRQRNDSTAPDANAH